MNFSDVVAASQMAGEDPEETKLLKKMLEEARNYITSFDWCRGIEEEYLGIGIGGVVAVFLFKIVPRSPGIDRWLWAVVGDLPPAYLVTEDAPNPACALAAYVGEMWKWANAAMEGRPVDELIPVNVPPTSEYARELQSRLGFLETEILMSRHAEELTHCEWGQDILRKGRQRGLES